MVLAPGVAHDPEFIRWVLFLGAVAYLVAAVVFVLAVPYLIGLARRTLQRIHERRQRRCKYLHPRNSPRIE